MLLKTRPLLCETFNLHILHQNYRLLWVKVTGHLGILILFMLVIWIMIYYLHPTAFVVSLDSVVILKTIGEAMSDLGWQQSMIDEMAVLHSNDTWDLVPLPDGKIIVDCRRVYTVKIGYDGKIDCRKARLLAKGTYKSLALTMEISSLQFQDCICLPFYCLSYYSSMDPPSTDD